MMSTFNLCVSAFIVSFGQLVFSDRVISGLLVWLGIFFLYPWSAIGSLIAVGMAVLVHCFLNVYTREQQAAGWGGFNAAIVGIFWGGGLADNSASVSILIAAVLLIVVLEVLLKRTLNYFRLPILSSPSMTVILILSFAIADKGQWYWTSVLAQYWYGYDVYLGTLCLVLAMAVMNFSAAGWALSMSALSCLVLSVIGIDTYQHLGFWALNVPLAVFAVASVFFINPLHKVFATIVVMMAVSLVWIVWFSTLLHNWIPPIVIPMILAIWFTLLILRKYEASDYLSVGFWRIFMALRQARKNNIPIHLLVCPEGEVRAHLEGLLTEPEDVEKVVRDPAIWEIGQRLTSNAISVLCRNLLNTANHSFFENILMLESVDQKRLSSNEKLISLNEASGTVCCIECSESKPWPTIKLWKFTPLCCETCGGAIVPGSLISWLSANYFQKKLSVIFDKHSLTLILSSKSDILIDCYVNEITSISSQEIQYVISDSLLNSDKNNIDRDEVILRRIVRLHKLLRISDAFKMSFLHIQFN